MYIIKEIFQIYLTTKTREKMFLYLWPFRDINNSNLIALSNLKSYKIHTTYHYQAWLLSPAFKVWNYSWSALDSFQAIWNIPHCVTMLCIILLAFKAGLHLHLKSIQYSCIRFSRSNPNIILTLIKKASFNSTTIKLGKHVL